MCVGWGLWGSRGSGDLSTPFGIFRRNRGPSCSLCCEEGSAWAGGRDEDLRAARCVARALRMQARGETFGQPADRYRRDAYSVRGLQRGRLRVFRCFALRELQLLHGAQGVVRYAVRPNYSRQDGLPRSGLGSLRYLLHAIGEPCGLSNPAGTSPDVSPNDALGCAKCRAHRS